MADYTISGLQPKLTGGEWEHGDSWFLFDESGTFSVDKDIRADIYLVGGGEKGKQGSANYPAGKANGGKGGDGGYVCKFSNVQISKNSECNVVIADVGIVSGTTLDVSGNLLSCNSPDYVSRSGGVGASVTYFPNNGGSFSTSNSHIGEDGVETPYGFVGSSGGGGSAYFLRRYEVGSNGGNGAGRGTSDKGTNATKYGCGGGGGGAEVLSSSSQHGDSGGNGQGGCVIICVIEDVEIPDTPDLTYDGLVQYPFGENGIKGVVITGDLSATAAGKYTSYLNLESDDLCWSDGTRREIKVEWEIKTLVVPKPTLSQYEYDYNGSAVYDNTLYKLPSIEWNYDSPNVVRDNIMDIAGTGTVQQYKAGTYPVTFSLKHSDSCRWSDGNTDDFTLDWVIKKIKVPIPEITSEDFTYSGQSYGINQTVTERKVVVENYDPKIMTQTGHTGNYSDAGNHYLAYTLRDPDSCSWEDNTVTAKRVYWGIKKQVVFLDVPYLADDQKLFPYDGTTHTPVITNKNTSYMNVDGTTSSVSANTEEVPYWEIVISLKTFTNYEYRWKDEKNKDGAVDNITLRWQVTVGEITPPTLKFTETDYTGQAQTNTVNGYNSSVMQRLTGGNSLTQTKAGTYSVTYALKDKNSAVWADTGNSEDRVLEWIINPITVPPPTVSETSFEVIPTGTGGVQTITLPIAGTDTDLMTVSNTGTYPGKYTATVKLKDSTSCMWKDEETGKTFTGNITFDWEITRMVVKFDKPELNETDYTYNGEAQLNSLKNWYSKYQGTDCMSLAIDGVAKSSNSFSAKAVGDYTVTVGFKSQLIYEYQWKSDTNDTDDISADSVELTWTIEKGTFEVPKITPGAIKYDGKTHSVKEIGYNSYVMSRLSGYALSGTAAKEYSVTYKLNDINSAAWSDGSAENKTVNWVITEGDVVKIPDVSPLEFEYNGNSQKPIIGNYDKNLIQQSGIASATDAGDYQIVFTLKNTGSCLWEDGTDGSQTVDWKIAKKIVKYSKPQFDESSPDYPFEFNYDGKEHSAKLVGIEDGMIVTLCGSDGNTTINGLKATKADIYTITVSLKNNPNYEYRWDDDTTAPVTFTWKINKTTAIIPTISQDTFYYGAYSTIPVGVDEYRIVYAYRNPEVFGYNPDIMNQIGISEGYWINSGSKPYNRFKSTQGRWFGDSQWALGKYYINFTLKDPESCEWVDGETGKVLDVDKITYEWSIVREIKLLPKPYLKNSSFKYIGLEITPVVSNDNVGVDYLEDSERSATAKGNYVIKCIPAPHDKILTIYDYRWEDNTTDVISLYWEISRGTAETPTISPRSFLYDGMGHIPVISGLDENKVDVIDYTEKTEAGTYTITFSIKDKSSCTWTDGTTDDKERKWVISESQTDKPTITPEFMQYDGEEHTVEFIDNQKDHSFIVSGYDPDIMTVSGDLKATNVGEYETVISLKDPISCSWSDGTVDPVKLLWKIQKKTVLLDKPYVEPPFEYIFDGSWHTPVIQRYQTPGMYIKGGSVTSAFYHGDYTITFCLVEDSNITYLWGDEELNAVDGELEYAWKITKAVGENGVEKPVVTNLTFPYDKQYHSPTISEYDTALVSQDGTSRAWENKTYTLTFSLKYPNDTEWKGGGTANVAYTWEIVKPMETVDMPYLEPVEFVYDAKEHQPEVKNLADVLQVVENVSQKDVGTHYVIVGFKSTANSGLVDYTWEDGSTANISLPWKITKKTDLKKPDITPKKFTYDGTEHKPDTVDYDELFADYDGIKKATAAGSYAVAFSLKNPDFCTWEDGTVDDVECVWEIEKASFPKPEVTVLKYLYNAQEHAPKITGFNEKVMSFSSDTTLSATSVGTYTIKISLNDTTSATWEDGTTDDVTYTWEINKVKLTPPTVNKTEFTYNGGEHKPTVSLFNPFLVEQSGTNAATNAGEYTITFSLIDPANYEWAAGGTENIDVKWKINRRQVDKPYIDPDSYQYTGREITAKIKNFKDTAMVYREGSVIKATLVGDYSATIGVNDNYEWADGTMDDVVLDWHITKIFVPVPMVDNWLLPYNGSEQSPDIGEYNPYYVSAEGTFSATNAGDYEIKFSLKDKEHCEWEKGGSDDIVYSWHIAKIMLPKPVGIKTQFTYNGGYHLPVIENIKETLMSFKGSNREINAGTYKYTIILNDKVNYIYDDNTVSDIDIVWTIGRKPVPVPFIEPTEFEYDGSSRSPVIKNFISDFMEIASGSRSSATEAGEYAISIALGKRVSTSPNSYYYLRNWEWDTENGGYGDITLTWRISKKVLQYPTLLENEFTYDGKPHSPVKSGYLSRVMGIVGTDIETNAGDYEVGFYLIDTKNYEWAEGVVPQKMLDWRILRAKLNKNDLPEQSSILVYNGGNQSPSWNSKYSPSKYTVSGDLNERNAGIYYALFSPSENYTWADGTTDEIPVPWNITKAGIKEPEQVNIPQYSGKEQYPQWDYDPTFVTIELSGDISGVNAGEYVIDFKCDGNCYFLSSGTDVCSTYWKIVKKSLARPEVEQKYTYTGDVITPQFKNYDPDILEISGETEGVEVKDYSAYFQIKDNVNYAWDNSVFVDPKTNKVGVGWRIVRPALTANIPQQRNWLIYNGERKTPSFWNYDTSLMLLIGGVPSKINAGIYYSTFRLRSNVVWEDGTTEDKIVPWKIDKRKYPKPYIKTSEATGGMYYYEIEGKRYPIWVNYIPDIMAMSGDVYDIDNSWHITDFDFKDSNNYAWSDGESDRFSIRWKLSEPYDPTRVPGTGDKTVHIPRQIKPPYTDGATKYPKWDRFDDTAIMKIGGAWEGVETGAYYVILELREGYVWEDGTYDIKAVPWKILSVGESKPKEPDPIVIHIPEQINIPYYDGWVKEPEWDIWDKFGIDVVKGDLYGVVARGYPLVLRPQSGYVWEDGTTEDKTVMWYINPRNTNGIEIPDDDVPKAPYPEKGDDDNGDGDNCVCCCCGCDTGLFDMLNNAQCDNSEECDCTKEVEI